MVAPSDRCVRGARLAERSGAAQGVGGNGELPREIRDCGERTSDGAAACRDSPMGCRICMT